MRALVFGSLLLTFGCGDNDTPDPGALVVTIDSAPLAATRETAAQFTFSADGAASFTCSLDGATPAACTSPHSVTVGDGTHTFSVRALTTALEESAPDTYEWRVDTVSPDTAITSSPSALSNSATATFELAGTPVADVAGFECKLDGADFAACTSPVTINVTDGARTFEARAVDAVGNSDGSPATVSFTVDTMAPSIAITSGPSGITPDTTVSFDFTAGTDAAAIECSVDAGTFATCASPFTATLAEGAHTFTVRVTDTATNTASATRTFTIDNEAPDVTITGPTITSDTTPELTFSSTTTPITFRCRVDGGTFATCTSPFTPTLTDGPHTLDVEAEDEATNVGSATLAFTIDSIDPTVTIVAPLIPARVNNAQPAVAFTTADATTLVLECAIDTGSFAVCTSGFTSASPLTDGPHIYHVRATDEASNETTVDVTFTVDTTVPEFLLVVLPPSPSSDTTPTFEFVIANATAVRCELSTGEVVDPCPSVITFGPLAAGTYTLTVIASDDAVVPNVATRVLPFEIATCGDGVRTGTEQCDGVDFNGQTCASFPPSTGGTLGCTAQCTIDVSQCSACGDGVIQTAAGEECEPPPLLANGLPDLDGAPNTNGETCQSQGANSGNLGCNPITCKLDDSPCWTLADDGFTGGKVCVDGLRSGRALGIRRFAACTETQGIWRGDVVAAPPDLIHFAEPAWANANGGVANFIPAAALIGRGIATADQGGGSWRYFSGNVATAAPDVNMFNVNDTNFSLTDVVWMANAQTRVNPAVWSLVLGGNTHTYGGGWDPVSGQAIVIHGSTRNLALCTTNNQVSPACSYFPALLGASVTGTVTGIATGSDNPGGQGNALNPLDVHVAVFGKNGDLLNNDAQGGVFWTCNSGGAYVADMFVPAVGGDMPDKNLVWKIVADYSSFKAHTPTSTPPERTCPTTGGVVSNYAEVMYVALRGGTSIYKTVDGGATWFAANTGLPANVEVFSLDIDCAGMNAPVPSQTCPNNKLLYAATSQGLYKSTNGAATWTLDGLPGQVVRAVAIQHTRAFNPIPAGGATMVGNIATFDSTDLFQAVKVGDVVTVSRVPEAGYNGTWVVTSATATTFSVKLPVASLPASGGDSSSFAFTRERVISATDQPNGIFQSHSPVPLP